MCSWQVRPEGREGRETRFLQAPNGEAYGRNCDAAGPSDASDRIVAATGIICVAIREGGKGEGIRADHGAFLAFPPTPQRYEHGDRYEILSRRIGVGRRCDASKEHDATRPC